MIRPKQELLTFEIAETIRTKRAEGLSKENLALDYSLPIYHLNSILEREILNHPEDVFAVGAQIEPAQLKAIRDLAYSGHSIREISRRLSLSRSTVTRWYPPDLPRRTRGGSDNGRAKLTSERVREARREYVSNPSISVAELARRYGVTSTAMYLALNGETWQHVS